MAINTFDTLKAAISEWVADASVAARAADFIALAEARLNRMVRHRSMETRATLSVGGTASNTVALPADFIELKEIHIVGAPDLPLSFRSPQFVETQRDLLTGNPIYYAAEGGNLSFAATAPANTDFSILYYAKIPALSVSVTDNWLLLAHPDVYLYGSLVQTEAYRKDERIPVWKSALDEAIQEVNGQRDGDNPGTRRPPA